MSGSRGTTRPPQSEYAAATAIREPYSAGAGSVNDAGKGLETHSPSEAAPTLAPIPLESALYTGWVRHRRQGRAANTFRYGVYQLLLNLDELPDVARRIPFLGHNAAGVTSFHDRDHLSRSDVPVREKLATWLKRHGLELGGGPVLLLTNLRVLGYVFNPVSYFYCLDESAHLRFVVAEVNNTFGETHPYLLKDFQRLGHRTLLSAQKKVFHVSPFIEIEGVHYDWMLTPPGERLVVHIDEFRSGTKFFDATLSLRRRTLTGASLAKALVRYPHMTARTIFLIHWQALKLWRKGAPFHRKPQPPSSGLEER